MGERPSAVDSCTEIVYKVTWAWSKNFHKLNLTYHIKHPASDVSHTTSDI